MNLQKHIGVIIFTFFLIVIIVVGLYQQNDLIQNKKYAIGRIVNYRVIKGNGPGLSIVYLYKVDGEELSGVSNFVGISISEVKRYLLSKQFPVIYNSKSPSSSDILITRQNFIKYKCNYPDSLKWVCDSLKIDKCR